MEQRFGTSRDLEIALANLGQGVFLIDRAGRIVYCNAQLWKLLNVTRTQLLGSNYTFLFTRVSELSCNPQRTLRELQLALQSLNERPTLYPQMQSQPSERFQVRLFPIEATGQDAGHWGGTVSDVTEEWRTIAERTEQLYDFTAELWRPLAMAKGGLSMLLDSYTYWDDSERRRQLSTISRDMEQMSKGLAYAQQLLRLETDAAKLNMSLTSVRSVIGELLNSMKLNEHGHQCKVEIEDDLPEIELDSFWVERALRNLIEHVIRQSIPGSAIEIAAWSEADTLLISITDDRHHIAEQQLDSIFKPFFRLHPDDSDYYTEVGLGLYVVERIVQMHGGHVWAVSTPAEGTTIHLVLPKKTLHSDQLMVPPLVPSGKLPNNIVAKSDHSDRKVLIVEDDPHALRLLQSFVEEGGYQSVGITRGRKVVDTILAEKPDVVLLDLHLPDMNGLEICQRIRDISAVPIVFVTASARTEDTARALDFGADDYIVKPVNRVELLARIRAHTRRAETQDTASQPATFRLMDLQIDNAAKQVEVKGQPVKLSKIEYSVLSYLATNAGHVLTHTQILTRIWGNDAENDTHYLWVTMSRLRKKLEDDPANPRYILNEPGVGYYMPAPVNTGIEKMESNPQV